MSLNQQWDLVYFQVMAKSYRHYEQQFWQIPTAIIIVDTFLLSVKSSILPIVNSDLLVIFAIFFTIAFTARQFTVTRRLRTIQNLIIRLVKTQNFERQRMSEFMQFAQLLQVRVGYWVTILLAGFTIYLIFLLVMY